MRVTAVQLLRGNRVPFGVEAYNLTRYFNLPKIFETHLHHGVDPRNGKKSA
jgi:hypothetical protein